MPRNFSELKSGGGTIPMLSPHAEKWGTRPPRPPPIDTRDASYKGWAPLHDLVGVDNDVLA